MYTGVGVDILRICRMEQSLGNPRFLTRVFGERELEQYHRRGEKVSFLAANFCAKEAFGKALGTGVRRFRLREVEVLRDALGKPFFRLSGQALLRARESGLEFSVSLSHTNDCAIAFVVAAPSDARR